MALQLPNASSVIDYLNVGGKDSSFTSRKKMYGDLKLDSTLGDYVGSESQNRAFLKSLQAQDTAPAPVAKPNISANAIAPNIPFSNFGAQNAVQQAAAPALPATSAFDLSVGGKAPIKVPPPAGQSLIPNQSLAPKPTTAAGVLAGAGVPDFGAYKPVDNIQATEYKTPSGTSFSVDANGNTGGGNATPDETTSAQYDAQVKAQGGFSATDIVPDFNPSESDLINDYLSSQEGQNLMDRVRLGELDSEAAKEEASAALDAKYASDFKKTEETLAANGLAFSGVRTTQLKALSDNLAASQLGVDREFASKLLDADLDLREGIQKGVADLVKEAQAKNKDAIQQLNAVGLAVVNGQLVPTLASRTADRQDRQLELSEERLNLAEASAARAEARFTQLYGAGKGELYQNVQALLDREPSATEQDIKIAIRANPDVFGTPSEAEITDAVSLVGLPPGLRQNIAAQEVKLQFDKLKPGILARLAPGDQSTAAFEKAKQAAKQHFLDVGGTISKDDTGTREYKLNSKQLTDLNDFVDTITQDDLKNL